MSRRFLHIALGVSLIGVTAFYYLRKNQVPAFDTIPGEVPQNDAPVSSGLFEFDLSGMLYNVSTSLGDTVLSIVGLSNIPPQYKGIIDDAEKRYGIPSGMLGRLLYTESRFRDDIISGKTKSSVGALGIAQFMPATAKELGIDPLNPNDAIYGAARYLANLHANLGDWTKAVAAYNWGIGNVKKKGMASMPTETQNYVKAILG